MKFGKEFASQMVPEWEEAYMNYDKLKAILKDILHLRQRMALLPAAAESPQASLKRKVSLYRAFSGLTSRSSSQKGYLRNAEDEPILVNAVQGEGSEGGYQTMFLMSSEVGGDKEVMFFRNLDREFNKIVKFYKDKVEEVTEDAEQLNEQMDAFIALRIKVENPVVQLERTETMNLAANHGRSSMSLGSGPISGRSNLDVIHEVEMSSNGHGEGERRGGNVAKRDQWRNNKGKTDKSRPASLEILNHVEINCAPETPGLTLKGILGGLKSDFSFTKEELRKVEELMKQAFTEFYHRLRILKSYCFLNQLAFSKILKKYDKITSRNASKVYLDMVDNSYLGTSDEVTRLMERVETAFIKHFSKGNRHKGMKILRPKAKRDRHRITFFLGFFSGCSVALVVALVFLIHARNILKSEGRGQYMENIFPLYSLFGFIVLHMLMYSANLYFWKRHRINYPFIFGFKEGTELGYREVFLLSSALAVLALAAVLSNLDMEMDPGTRSFRALTELVPLGLVTVLLLIIACPFNIIYRSSRYFLIQCVVHCICAPLYKVKLPDFFLGDQLTSQVQAFRSLEFYVCYYGWGDFKRRSNKCHENSVYQTFYFVVAIIPYWVRFLQCVRRLFDERDSSHVLNGFKYFSTIVAVFLRTASDMKWGVGWKVMAAVTSGIATIVSTYWDIVCDWGLLQRNSKNPWLRDKLLVSKKSVYFAAMVVNIILRFAWMQSVLGFHEAPFLHKRALAAIVACLEIIRRGIWNFFRLENEHLNNVGKFRAFKSVPLPFNHRNELKQL
ncbi:phosphate transporter PHO1 homolog 9-like [Malania oleifera]|uniref:phosphate transporter PHO1 homolog 9-like n=1 Tax=Malania oleifera TaxID=397392 RepID=UPI0025AE88E5|nr:phosphate transporter PHO1 homolog 9-like [Malania oleifera]